MSRHLKNYVATRAATRLVMDAAKSEKAKAGRVTMPKVFFVIGIIGFVLLAAVGIALRQDSPYDWHCCRLCYTRIA